MDFQKLHQSTCNLAREAGKVALHHRANGVKAEHKEGYSDDVLSVVTAADLAIDTFLREKLTEKYPQIGWLSEETEDDLARLDCDYIWVVDPIDGTKSFLKPDGDFAVSIGLAHKGEAVLGVIYNPNRDELISGYVGGGVFYNGEPLYSPKVPEKLENAVCLVSTTEWKRGMWVPYEGKVRLKEEDSVAYKLALVAAGRADLTASLKPKSEWDVAAGAALCREAGLKVTDLAGNPYLFNKKVVEISGVLVAPPGLYEQMRKLLPAEPLVSYQKRPA